MTEGQRKVARRTLSIGIPLALWYLLTAPWWPLGGPLERLPGPGAVVVSVMAHFRGVLWLDVGFSLMRIGAGFLLATVLGLCAGLAAARSRVAGDLTVPVLEVLRPIPAIAAVPLAILVFPNAETAMIAITCAAAFFPIYVSVRHAARGLPQSWESAVLTLGASRGQLLRKVTLPGLLPGLFSGMSVGVGVAWVCLISAEMISGQLGVGYRTWQSYTLSDYAGVLAGIVEIAVLGLATSGFVEWVGRRCTRWMPRV